MKVFEIFKSISGEVAGCPQGSLATFIRFSGCNLKCIFCDAEETQSGKIGSDLSVDEILNKVNEFGLKNIIITGGEPLKQKNGLIELTDSLEIMGYDISIETNGSIIPFGLSTGLTIIMDYKLDQEDKMNKEAFLELTSNDYIKFVIEDFNGIKKAIKVQQKLMKSRSFPNTQFAYSPMMPKMTDIMKDPNHIIKTQNLAKMITDELMKNQLQGIINIQMHKILNLA